MATLTLRLEVDATTKKKNVWVKLDSDADALPMEHEEQHRRIVEALLSGGTVKAEELGTVVIEREAQPIVGEETSTGEGTAAAPKVGLKG